MHLQLSQSPEVVLPGGGRQTLAHLDAALLTWLVLQGPTPRPRLATLLWPQAEVEAARNALRQRLFQLRRQVGPDLLEGSTVLRLQEGVTHDLTDAATVLEGFAPVGPEFDAWLEQERAVARHKHQRVVLQRCDTAESAGSYTEALEHAQHLLQIEPLSEEAHRRIIRLHYLSGDRAQALLAFDRCERVLKDEVGARPSPQTLQLLSTIDNAGVVALQRGRNRQLPVVLLRPPRLIGREAEFELLVQAALEQRPVLLMGEAGMGKSRLLADLVAWHKERAPERPLLVVRARPGDEGQAYSSVARCLRAVLGQSSRALPRETSHELARLLPELGQPRTRSLDPERVQLRRAVVEAFRQSQRDLAGLWLDDLHFADTASVELLLHATVDAREHGVVIGLASRPSAGTPAHSLHRAWRLDHAVQQVTLQPLTELQLHSLVESLAQPDLDAAALTPELMRVAGGNPMFTLELLKHAWESGSAVQRRSVATLRPVSVGQIIGQRLERLSGEALALARLAALAGPDFDIELAEGLLHTPALRLADAWNELEAAQVLRGAQFAHDLVHETVLQTVPAMIARHSHQSLAKWLEGSHASPERIAAHWAAAGETARTVVPWLTAGRQALARGFLPQARELLERAAQAAAATEQRSMELEVLQQLHETYTMDDPGAAHEAVVERLQWLAGNTRETLHAHAAQHNLARRRHQPIDTDAVRADLALAVPLDDEALVVKLAQLLLSEHLRRGEPDLALAVNEEYSAWFERDGDPVARSDRLGNLAAILANLDRFAQADQCLLQAAEIARDADLGNELMILLANRMRLLRAQGRSAGLQWLVMMDEEHSKRHANVRSWAQSRMVASELLRDAGQYREAQRVLAQERDKTTIYGGALAPLWDIAEASLWLHLGQHGRALAVLRKPTSDAWQVSPPWLQARWRLTQAQVQARVAGQGLQDLPNAQARAWLSEAAELAPRDSRRAVWFDVALQRAQWADADAGMALAEGLAQQAMGLVMVGYAYRAWWLACERALDAKAPTQASHFATLAQALKRFRFDESGQEEEVFPTGASKTWVLAVEARWQRDVLSSPQAWGQARAQLVTVAHEHVAPEFRESFLQRVPAHLPFQAMP